MAGCLAAVTEAASMFDTLRTDCSGPFNEIVLDHNTVGNGV